MLTMKFIDFKDSEGITEIESVWFNAGRTKSLEIADSEGNPQIYDKPGVYYVMNENGATIAKYTIPEVL